MLERTKRRVDYLTIWLYLCLLGIGWSMLYSVGYGSEGYTGGFANFLQTPVGKQTIWLGISGAVLGLVLIIDHKFWRTFAYGIYGVLMLLLAGVFLFGKEINGATSWYAFGGFSIQPSELAKFGTCLAIAAFLSRFGTDLREVKSQATAFALFLAPAFLIILQPDAGSALVFMSFLLVLYREGLPSIFYVLAFSVVGLFIAGIRYVDNTLVVHLSLLFLSCLVFFANFQRRGLALFLLLLATGAGVFLLRQEVLPYLYALLAAGLAFVVGAIINWRLKRERMVGLMIVCLVLASSLVEIASIGYNLLKSHQQDRINVWLNPEKCDPQGSLYNLLNSKMAISNGGVAGQGWLNGMVTKGGHVPEQSTDFIFCTIAEEQGFLGSLAIVGFFLVLLWRITMLAERQRSKFARAYAYGVAGLLFVHFFINIGMTMGVMPVVGIPLPFISKGGSSLLGFTIMIGVLIRFDQHRYDT